MFYNPKSYRLICLFFTLFLMYHSQAQSKFKIGTGFQFHAVSIYGRTYYDLDLKFKYQLNKKIDFESQFGVGFLPKKTSKVLSAINLTGSQLNNTLIGFNVIYKVDHHGFMLGAQRVYLNSDIWHSEEIHHQIKVGFRQYFLDRKLNLDLCFNIGRVKFKYPLETYFVDELLLNLNLGVGYYFGKA